MKKKILTLLVLLMTAVTGAWAGTQATGYFDSCTAHHGSIRVKGWAYDPDQPSVSIQVHAYIWYGSSVGTSKDQRMPAVGINTDVERSDVNSAKGITGLHGFDRYITVPAGTYTVEIYAIDKTGDGNPKIPGTGSNGKAAAFTVTVTADPYNITYDANGGSDAPAAQQKGEFVQINLSGAEPTREGYTFKEWNTAQDGSGDSYAPGAAYTADGDATLYAQWEYGPIDLTPSADGRTWTLATMPDCNVELEVEYETALALSEETDNAATLAEWDGYEADVTLTRTLVTGSWNTFAMPFTISSSTLNTLGITAKKLVSSSLTDGILTLNFEDAENIEAGKPYLVKVSADLSFKDNTFNSFIVSKTAKPFTSDNVDFIPTLGATTIPDGDTKEILFLASGNTLKHPSSLPTSMKGFRAYFQLKGDAASARMFAMDFGEGETTGISLTPAPSPKGEGSIYTLDGRRISKATQKGVYIQNGKKLIIK